MSPEDFDRITGKLEPPTKDEAPVILDGTQITPDYVRETLGLPKRRPQSTLRALGRKLVPGGKRKS
jgi:hypothetical protein